jgi:hypothetical protein
MNATDDNAMDDNATDNRDPRDAGTPRPARAQRLSRGVRAAAMVAGGLVAGGVLAGAVGASAATSGTATATPSATGYGTTGNGTTGNGTSAARAGSGQGRSDETVVTGTTADTLRAAALKAVAGGTVDRIETDAGDAAYEVHMTKSDGTKVTVKFDDSLALVRVEDGMGLGDPAPPGAGSSGSSSTTPSPST